MRIIATFNVIQILTVIAGSEEEEGELGEGGGEDGGGEPHTVQGQEGGTFRMEINVISRYGRYNLEKIFT